MKTTATLLAVVASVAISSGASAQCNIGRPINIGRPVITNPPRIIRVVERPVYTLPVVDRHHELQLASQLRQQATDITWELYRNYRNNYGFEATYAEMYELLDSVKHLEEVIRHSGRSLCQADMDHIREDLLAIDGLFHHVQDDVASWTPRTNCSRVRARLFSQIERMEDTLHHLMEDYHVSSSIGAPPAPSTALLPPRL